MAAATSNVAPEPETPYRVKSHSPTYEAILRAGPRIRPLKQAHAHLVVCGLHRSRALLTKLLSLACSSTSASSSPYIRLLLLFVPSPDAFLFNSLIRASSKSRSPLSALSFYLRMRSALLPPSNFTFTSVIKACSDLSDLPSGRLLHSHTLVLGFSPDPYVQAALVTLYSKSADLNSARMVFDKTPHRTIIAWNAMISGYEQNGLAKEAVEVFYLMREAGVAPDSATLVSLLSACSHLGHLSLGQWVHDYIIDNDLEVNEILGTSLINMYSRCGCIRQAREAFDRMRRRNVVAWTAIISGYGMHGYGDRAIELFHQMRVVGQQPNDVTFVAVLSACAHAGMVREGCEAFECMVDVYRLFPRVEHHVCVVDMLGRAGFLNEAVQFIREWIHGEPAPAVWTALLSACKMHKDSELGVEVAERLLNIEPENPGHYVLLSNIYALAGRMDRVEMVRDVMIRKGLKKQTGYSLIEVNNVSHMFCMGDSSHPQATEIYCYLEDLIWKMTEAGYVPATEPVMHELEEEEREVSLRFHSEKLAIAFGLMNTSKGTLIRIVKNLRMCNDCHLAIKYISSITEREIIVRDKHRFHHFKDSSCSCHDYW